MRVVHKKRQVLPEIKIMKSICGSFNGRFCYSANNPYYSGHYPTREDATKAAARVKRKLASEAVTRSTLTAGHEGLPPIDDGLHTDELIAELQKPSLQLDETPSTLTVGKCNGVEKTEGSA